MLIKCLLNPKCVTELFLWGRWSDRRSPRRPSGQMCFIISIVRRIVFDIDINVWELLGQFEYTALRNSEASLCCPV